ncbi:hypothetical protein DIPPA_33817 [Diplonema papillatum]|nr:hypothetical protein DIPPA_33829 [Diplonema papillatum]KAJ9445762.1 hypothetical protein DIPPA_33817 [Diplonema papillatum]
MAVSDHGTARGPAVAPLLGGGLVALWTDIYSCYSQYFAPRIDKCTEVPR